MISIRKSFFETNSSSCHALVMSEETNTLPKTLYLCDDDKRCDYIRAMIREFDDENTKKFVHFLFNHGVENIVYNGSNPFMEQYIQEYVNLSNEQKEEISWDNEMPYIRHFTSSHVSERALINFLLGEYYDYIGHDDCFYHGSTDEAYILASE